MMNFIFDGGTIDDPARIHLQTDELDAAQFWPWEQAATKLPANTASRVPAARTARKDRRTIYLPAEPAHENFRD